MKAAAADNVHHHESKPDVVSSSTPDVEEAGHTVLDGKTPTSSSSSSTKTTTRRNSGAASTKHIIDDDVEASTLPGLIFTAIIVILFTGWLWRYWSRPKPVYLPPPTTTASRRKKKKEEEEQVDEALLAQHQQYRQEVAEIRRQKFDVVYQQEQEKEQVMKERRKLYDEWLMPVFYPPPDSSSSSSSSSSNIIQVPATSSSSCRHHHQKWLQCHPLDTVEELWTWSPPVADDIDPPALATVRYQPPPANILHANLRRGKLLACHDMQGGYLGDRHCYGHGCDWEEEGPAFRLYQWDLLDGLIYFSHHLITLPPPSWISLCHRNGVKALGTLITEWEEGKAKCQQLFASPEKAEETARQLIRLAIYHGFEGWLINIENDVDWGGGIENILHFLRCLTEGMKQAVGEKVGLVLWYDSVTADTGELKWQDGLTLRNQVFFEACDGIFTNYTWKREEPINSGGRAGLSRRWDVYMGIDVFGRNTYGGGGYDCDKALEVIRNAGVSAALFAPGWVWEKEVQEAKAAALAGRPLSRPTLASLAAARAAKEAAAAAKEGGEGKEKGKEEDDETMTGNKEEEEEEEEHSSHTEDDDDMKKGVVWSWNRIEAEFEARQELFWAKISQIWPRRPFPYRLQEPYHPYTTNFNTGVGLGMWIQGKKVAMYHHHHRTGGEDQTLKPWYNLSLQDPLPLTLTLCSRALPKTRPHILSSYQFSQVAAEDEAKEAHLKTDEGGAVAIAQQMVAGITGVTARVCYRTAYSGGSSLVLSGVLEEGGACRASLPFLSLDTPCQIMPLEIKLTYKTPHWKEDEICIEVVLHHHTTQETFAGKVKMVTSTSHLILRPTEGMDDDDDDDDDDDNAGEQHEEEQHTAAASSSSSSLLRGSAAVAASSLSSRPSRNRSSWLSKRLGKTLHGKDDEQGGKKRETRKIFYTPVAEWMDDDNAEEGQASSSSSFLPHCHKSSQDVLEELVYEVKRRRQGGESFEEAQEGLIGATDYIYEDADDGAAIEALPWRHRLFRIRELSVEADHIKEVRLVCLKRRRGGGGGAGLLPRPYRMYLGEFSMAHVKSPPLSLSSMGEKQKQQLALAAKKKKEKEEEKEKKEGEGHDDDMGSLIQSNVILPASPPFNRPTHLLLPTAAEGGGGASSSSCCCMDLQMKGGCCWDQQTGELIGQLSWSWSPPYSCSIIASTDIYLLLPKVEVVGEEGGAAETAYEKPLWLGRSLSCNFGICVSTQPILPFASSLSAPSSSSAAAAASGRYIILLIQPRDVFGNVMRLKECPRLAIDRYLSTSKKRALASSSSLGVEPSSSSSLTEEEAELISSSLPASELTKVVASARLVLGGSKS